jgi:hypothetical protein
MKRTYLIFISLCSFFSLSAHTVIILVHGTWGQEGSWYQPGGKFYTELQKSNPHLVSFVWVAHNRHEARVNAARNLAALIMSYPEDVSLILVGHSHGGNVINLASQLITDSHRIEAVFSLATPVSNESYYPNMAVITHYYHLFSLQDTVQPVFGMFERTYQHHERLFNCRVMIHDNEPDHHELHHACIGQWLLHSQKHIHKTKAHECVVSFYDHQKPSISIDHNQQTLVAASMQSMDHAVAGFSRKQEHERT